MIHHFVAIDLGASSGRVVVGRLEDDLLTLSEVHRFANGPMHVGDSLCWDVAAMEREIRRGVAAARESVGMDDVDGPGRLDGLGVDSWGVDYVLLDASGGALDAPFHYRDSRTAGIIERVCQRLGPDSRTALYARTGIQFLPFNTIFQLAADDPNRLARADGLLLTADYFAHRLGLPGSGRPVGEVTLASTSQLLDARTRTWCRDVMGRLGLPADLLPELVEAGSVIGQCDEIPIIATAAHDTAAAVAGCPVDPAEEPGDWAFLSAGTWSLLGMELPEPVLTEQALAARLSNEAGVGGTTRLLGNIMGQWLLQECRREWASAGQDRDWQELLQLAESAPPFAAVLDPDDGPFMSPGEMPAKIAAFCRRTGQTPPDSVGQFVRVILESLAIKTRWLLDRLEAVTRRRVRTIHLVGGGSNNRLLCQWTADATGRLVLAGPSEATAAGNLLTQAVGVGAIGSFADARRILRNSIELVEYEPLRSEGWDDAYGKLQGLIGL